MSYVIWSDLGETSERVADSYEGGFPPRLIIAYQLPPAPVASFTSNSTSTCIGTSINFTGNFTSGTPNSWLWNFGDGTTSTLQNPTHTYASAGNFTVSLTVSNAGGTNTNTQANYITINSNPTITFTGPTEICLGQSATIQAFGGTSYAWNSGLGTGAIKTVSPTSTTTYAVVVTNAAGCSETEGFSLTVNPLPTVIASADTSICVGSSATLSATGATNYSWSNGAGTSSSATVSPTLTTTYTVTGTTIGCSNTDQVVITVNAIPSVLASADATICAGSSTNISASGATSYSWSNGAGTAASATVSPSSTTTYSVTGTSNGCSSSDQVFITVNQLPTVNLNVVETICLETSPTILNGGIPVGGTYSGLGVSSGLFDPIATGVGDFEIIYSYTDVNGCTNMTSDTLSVQTCLSIEENNNNLFKIYPNPSNKNVTIKQLVSNGDMKLTVVDASGKLILSKTVTDNTVDIDVSNWAEGNYIFNVQSGLLTKSSFILVKH
jgi:hypothetical protein